MKRRSGNSQQHVRLPWIASGRRPATLARCHCRPGGECCREPAWKASATGLGQPAVVIGRIALLKGRPADPALILALGGRPARWAAGHDEPPGPAYRLRVWAARGLLWVWEDTAATAVVDALADEAWRVREMAARVVTRHGLTGAIPAVRRMARQDPNARVRAAAGRALEKLGSDEAHPTAPRRLLGWPRDPKTQRSEGMAFDQRRPGLEARQNWPARGLGGPDAA